MTLSGTNTYTGATTIKSGGTLIAASANALPTGGSFVDVLNGGTLGFSGGITDAGTAANNIYLAGHGVTNKATLFNVSGNNSTARTINLDATSGVVSIGAATATTLSVTGVVKTF